MKYYAVIEEGRMRSAWWSKEFTAASTLAECRKASCTWESR